MQALVWMWITKWPPPLTAAHVATQFFLIGSEWDEILLGLVRTNIWWCFSSARKLPSSSFFLHESTIKRPQALFQASQQLFVCRKTRRMQLHCSITLAGGQLPGHFHHLSQMWQKRRRRGPQMTMQMRNLLIFKFSFLQQTWTLPFNHAHICCSQIFVQPREAEKGQGCWCNVTLLLAFFGWRFFCSHQVFLLPWQHFVTVGARHRQVRALSMHIVADWQGRYFHCFSYNINEEFCARILCIHWYMFILWKFIVME